MPSSAEDVAHLLRRSGFFAAPARVTQLATLDWPAAVDAVLDISGAPAENLPPGLDVFDNQNGWKQHIALTQWWLDRCVSTPTPIVERMVHFWHGHFVASWSKIYNMPGLLGLHRLYRAQAVAKLEPFVQAMALQPAMLWYLDNAQNVAGSPNLNFARELMELFLLGVGNYTEADIVASAQAWTGHTTQDWNVATYVFRADLHDNSNKTFFGITRNWNGPDIVHEILTNGAKRPVVGRYLAKKLWEFFAYQNPSDSLVADLGAAFVASDLDVRELLRVIFNRPEFRSAQAKQGLVRSPIEYVVATLAGSGAKAADVHPEWTLEAMGQHPFDPPNVSGWRQNGYWVNSSAFNGRAMFAQGCGWYLKELGFWNGIENWSAAQAVGTAETAFGLTFSPPTRAALAWWFDTQKSGDGSWALHENFITLVLLTPEMNLA